MKLSPTHFHHILTVILLFAAFHLSCDASFSTRVSDGLQFLYTFEEGQFDDAANSTADISGINFLGNIVLTSGVSTLLLNRPGLYLPGSTSSQPGISTGDISQLLAEIELTGSFSMEAWFIPDSSSQSSTIWGFGGWNVSDVQKTRGCTTDPMTFDFMQDAGNLYAYQKAFPAPFPTCTFSATTIKSMALTHMLITYTANSSVSLFLNGKLKHADIPDTFYATWSSGHRLFLTPDVDRDSISTSWRGTINLISMYNRELTASEVLSNYNAGLPNAVPQPLPRLLFVTGFADTATRYNLTLDATDADSATGYASKLFIKSIPNSGVFRVLSSTFGWQTLPTEANVPYQIPRNQTMQIEYTPAPGVSGTNIDSFTFVGYDGTAFGRTGVISFNVLPVPIPRNFSLTNYIGASSPILFQATNVATVEASVTRLPSKGSLFPTDDGITAKGSALMASDLPAKVTNGQGAMIYVSSESVGSSSTTECFTSDSIRFSLNLPHGGPASVKSGEVKLSLCNRFVASASNSSINRLDRFQVKLNGFSRINGENVQYSIISLPKYGSLFRIASDSSFMFSSPSDAISANAMIRSDEVIEYRRTLRFDASDRSIFNDEFTFVTMQVSTSSFNSSSPLLSSVIAKVTLAEIPSLFSFRAANPLALYTFEEGFNLTTAAQSSLAIPSAHGGMKVKDRSDRRLIGDLDFTLHSTGATWMNDSCGLFFPSLSGYNTNQTGKVLSSGSGAKNAFDILRSSAAGFAIEVSFSLDDRIAESSSDSVAQRGVGTVMGFQYVMNQPITSLDGDPGLAASYSGLVSTIPRVSFSDWPWNWPMQVSSLNALAYTMKGVMNVKVPPAIKRIHAILNCQPGGGSSGVFQCAGYDNFDAGAFSLPTTVSLDLNPQFSSTASAENFRLHLAASGWSGKIHLLSLYDRALNLSEIQSNFRSGLPMYPPTPTLHQQEVEFDEFASQGQLIAADSNVKAYNITTGVTASASRILRINFGVRLFNESNGAQLDVSALASDALDYYLTSLPTVGNLCVWSSGSNNNIQMPIRFTVNGTLVSNVDGWKILQPPDLPFLFTPSTVLFNYLPPMTFFSGKEIDSFKWVVNDHKKVTPTNVASSISISIRQVITPPTANDGLLAQGYRITPIQLQLSGNDNDLHPPLNSAMSAFWIISFPSAGSLYLGSHSSTSNQAVINLNGQLAAPTQLPIRFPSSTSLFYISDPQVPLGSDGTILDSFQFKVEVKNSISAQSATFKLKMVNHLYVNSSAVVLPQPAFDSTVASVVINLQGGIKPNAGPNTYYPNQLVNSTIGEGPSFNWNASATASTASELNTCIMLDTVLPSGVVYGMQNDYLAPSVSSVVILQRWLGKASSTSNGVITSYKLMSSISLGVSNAAGKSQFLLSPSDFMLIAAADAPMTRFALCVHNSDSLPFRFISTVPAFHSSSFAYPGSTVGTSLDASTLVNLKRSYDVAFLQWSGIGLEEIDSTRYSVVVSKQIKAIDLPVRFPTRIVEVTSFQLTTRPQFGRLAATAASDAVSLCSTSDPLPCTVPATVFYQRNMADTSTVALANRQSGDSFMFQLSSRFRSTSDSYEMQSDQAAISLTMAAIKLPPQFEQSYEEYQAYTVKPYSSDSFPFSLRVIDDNSTIPLTNSTVFDPNATPPYRVSMSVSPATAAFNLPGVLTANDYAKSININAVAVKFVTGSPSTNILCVFTVTDIPSLNTVLADLRFQPLFEKEYNFTVVVRSSSGSTSASQPNFQSTAVVLFHVSAAPTNSTDASSSSSGPLSFLSNIRMIYLWIALAVLALVVICCCCCRRYRNQKKKLAKLKEREKDAEERERDRELKEKKDRKRTKSKRSKKLSTSDADEDGSRVPSKTEDADFTSAGVIMSGINIQKETQAAEMRDTILTFQLMQQQQQQQQMRMQEQLLQMNPMLSLHSPSALSSTMPALASPSSMFQQPPISTNDSISPVPSPASLSHSLPIIPSSSRNLFANNSSSNTVRRAQWSSPTASVTNNLTVSQPGQMGASNPLVQIHPYPSASPTLSQTVNASISESPSRSASTLRMHSASPSPPASARRVFFHNPTQSSSSIPEPDFISPSDVMLHVGSNNGSIQDEISPPPPPPAASDVEAELDDEWIPNPLLGSVREEGFQIPPPPDHPPPEN